MIKGIIIWIIFFSYSILSMVSFSQTKDEIFSSVCYRNTDNPLYWKNRKPYDGYWQQDVYYNIKATIDEKTDILYGEEELTYWNNSPHELPFIYFHLYQNAFQPGSYYEKNAVAQGQKMYYGKYGKEHLGIVIESLSVNSIELETELDNTILKVFLSQPLKSGDSVTLKIKFRTYFEQEAGTRRRMKMFIPNGYKHYNIVNWYPRIAVYDIRSGWCTDQHLGKEFYGDFGDFEVKITMANNFIIDGTGVLVNRDEVLPPALRKKLALSNFYRKPWNEKPSEIIPYDSTQTKTWVFHSENVHDVAYTADPTYRFDEVEWNGIKAVALVQESHAMGWRDAAPLAMKTVQLYSRYFGDYHYPKIIVADAQGSMEYPMLTLDNGYSPTYQFLLIHEIGHGWFFAQVGSNETYSAFMDEGFTQFISSWAMDSLEYDLKQWKYPFSSYINRFIKDVPNSYSNALYPYIEDALLGEQTPLNIHSDKFNDQNLYRQVYYKGASMLYNLKYVLGDSLFYQAMKYYYDKWKFCHPYPDDMRQAFSEYTKTDLNWFFDQWINTTQYIDYSVKSIKKTDTANQYQITLKRKGQMEMPLDVDVISKNDSVYSFYVPNKDFTKKINATVLPKWTGWNKFNPTYMANMTIPGGIKDVRIDSSGNMADINRLNNRTKFPVNLSFDSQIPGYPDWGNYELFIRPALWYNGYDGLKTGFHLNGDYMDILHKFDFTFWYNSQLVNNPLIGNTSFVHFPEARSLFSFLFNYSQPLQKISNRLDLKISFRSLDGLEAGTIGFEKRIRSGRDVFYAYFKSMIRTDSSCLSYLLFPDEWEVNKFNNTLNAGYLRTMRHKYGSASASLGIKSSSLKSDYDYSLLIFTGINQNKIGILNLKTRIFAGYGTGRYFPRESQLYIAGANPEEMMENKYTRSIGFFDNNWDNDGSNNWIGHKETTQHFHYGGGLNLRGYAGYLVKEESGEYSYNIYKGTTGFSLNAELEYNNPLGFRSRVMDWTIYLFGDAGAINTRITDRELILSSVYADAGIGTAITIKRWGPLYKIKPLTLRFDCPLFLNQPPADRNFYRFSWIIGVNRAF